MHLVGIVASNKKIFNVLKSEFDEKKVNFIDLNLDIIENFKNIKFDIILMSKISGYEKGTKKDELRRILSNSNICVINTDIKENLKIVDELKGTFITYGFNPKATITISSVNDTNILICIQRAIKKINNTVIEPIEYVESIKNIKNIEISDVIGVKTVEILLPNKKN